MKISYDTAQDTLAAVLAVTHAAFGVPVTGVDVKIVATAVGDAAGLQRAANAEQSHSDEKPADGGAAVDVTQRDKDGLPWDVRVHSTPASMTTAGVWRAKRNRAEADYAAVKAEYTGGGQQHTQTQTTGMQAPGGMKQPPAMSAPPTAAKTPYQKLFDYLTEMTKQGRAPADWVKDTLSDYGVQDGNILNLQSADPKFVQDLHDEFQKVLGE